MEEKRSPHQDISEVVRARRLCKQKACAACPYNTYHIHHDNSRAVCRSADLDDDMDYYLKEHAYLKSLLGGTND